MGNAHSPRHRRQFARRDRYTRLGMGLADARVATGAGEANPTTGTQGEEAATVVCSLTSTGVPDGVLFQSGDAVDNTVLSIATDQEITLALTIGSSLIFTTTVPSPVNLNAGPHVIAVAFQTDAVDDGRVEAYVDGLLIISQDTTLGEFTRWSSAAATWDAMQVTDPSVESVEVFFGVLPAIFVRA